MASLSPQMWNGPVLFIALGLLLLQPVVAQGQITRLGTDAHDYLSHAFAPDPDSGLLSRRDSSQALEIDEQLQRSLRGPAPSHVAGSRPGPNVPEPMVFDLVRPLGVRQGELEVNVLGFVPLRRTRSKTPQFSFITGADRGNKKRPGFEWAPEIEFGLVDNLALEFELPLAETTVEAYKGAVQYTLGTAFDDQFIHGLQGILFVDRSNGAVSPTLLYLAAWRFDSTYSMLTMFGFSHEFGSDNPHNPTQMLFNATLFAELNEHWTLGLEANYASELDGAAGLLFMPQVHWNPNQKTSIQLGIGTRASEGNFTGEIAFRLIREF